MESVRQKKVSSLIQKDISSIISEMLEKNTGIVITVTKVVVSADLHIAKIYISVFPSENSKEFLNELNILKSSIKYKLGQKLKNQLRLIPELLFYVDDSLDYIEKIDQLLNNPDNPIK